MEKEEEKVHTKSGELIQQSDSPDQNTLPGGECKFFRFYPLLVFLFIAAFFLSNFWWLKLNQSPPVGDEPLHLTGSYRALADLQNGRTGDFLFPTKRYYPPLILQFSSLFYLLLGRSHTTAVISLALFWFILIYSAYLIGGRLFGPTAGLLAAMASVVCPGNSTFLGKYLLDIPLAAMITLSFYLLLKSEKFTRPLWTYLFFAVCGLGMLTKWTFALFLAPPFLYTLGEIIYLNLKDKEKKRETLIILAAAGVLLAAGAGVFMKTCPAFENKLYLKKAAVTAILYSAGWLILFILSFIIKNRNSLMEAIRGVFLSLSICSGFYLINFISIKLQLFHGLSEGVAEGDTYSLFEFFVVRFARFYIGIIWLIILFLGLAWYFIAEKKSRDKNLLIFSILSIFIILYALPNKDTRYFYSLAGLMAPVLTFWVTRIKVPEFRVGATAFMAILALMGSLGWPLLLNVKSPKIGFLLSITVPTTPPLEKWPFKEIVKTINEDAGDKRFLVVILERKFIGEASPVGTIPIYFVDMYNRHMYPRGKFNNKINSSETEEGKLGLISSYSYNLEDDKVNNVYLVYFHPESNPAFPEKTALKIESAANAAGNWEMLDSYSAPGGVICDLYRLKTGH